ncbi:hypothetical protein AB0I55_04990 [Actinocatenispora sera]|uniref:hypothetical protein n=1 Tax=Actinocatenispora sera TaxID=390989 RepID=UPI003404C4AB
MPETAPPPPPTPVDAAAFMTELRRLKAWSGRSYRQLERCARAAGDTLPYSTTASMLGRDRLPREELLVAFVRACGIDDARPWAAARATLAQGAPAVPHPTGQQPAPAGGCQPSTVSADSAVRDHPGSRWARPPRQLVAAAVLLVAVAVALTVGVTYTLGGHTANVSHTVLDR